MPNCQRCGRECQVGVGNPEARLLRKAQKGLCANCAVTAFLLDTEPIVGILKRGNPLMLLNPMVQEQFGNILISGNSDASLREIDWDVVVSQWGLPMPKQGRR